jgi:hypothetical protein
MFIYLLFMLWVNYTYIGYVIIKSYAILLLLLLIPNFGKTGFACGSTLWKEGVVGQWIDEIENSMKIVVRNVSIQGGRKGRYVGFHYVEEFESELPWVVV